MNVTCIACRTHSFALDSQNMAPLRSAFIPLTLICSALLGMAACACGVLTSMPTRACCNRFLCRCPVSSESHCPALLLMVFRAAFQAHVTSAHACPFSIHYTRAVCRCSLAARHGTAQHSIAQHSTAQHSTAQHSCCGTGQKHFYTSTSPV